MHSVLNIYMNDLLPDNKELPRSFTESVTRAVILKQFNDYISWSDFLPGFPIAVRHRRVLWDRFFSGADPRFEPGETFS